MIIEQQTTIRLVVISCTECGIQWGVPEHFHKQRYDSGDAFYCPNGHGRAYTESEVSRLQKQIERDGRVHQRTRAHLEDERRSHWATKGNATKLKDRIAKGMCPCCRRPFTNLRKHMGTKHPGYADKVS